MVVLTCDGDTVCDIMSLILKYYGCIMKVGHDMMRGGENTN